MRRLATLALALAAGCDTGFSPQYLVEDLRILAVRVQVVGSLAADADLGETVRLTALVANPRGRAPLRALGDLHPRRHGGAPPASTRTRCAISTRSSLIRASSRSVRGRRSR